MTITVDLIEDWIQIRSTLQRQIKVLETMESSTVLPSDRDRRATIVRLRAWIVDLNTLLKDHARIE